MNKKLLISAFTGIVVLGGIIFYFNYTPTAVDVSAEPSLERMCVADRPECNDTNVGIVPTEPNIPPKPSPAISPDLSAQVAVAITLGAASPSNSANAYTPANITVKKGTVVTWTNQDNVKHNVMSDSGSVLSSPYLAKGESWSYAFNDTGSFPYHCTPHPWMKGTVTVVE